MRQVLAEELEKLMAQNEDIVLLDADLMRANGLSSLKRKFPERAINVGIAEQNMACVAAGMSSYGMIPFISTFAPFATRRICDQVAISCAYARQNVKIIGTDPGISAELNGGTHMSFEDIGVLRSIPGIVIFEPTDGTQLRRALPQIADYYGVVYIRMIRKSAPDVFDDTCDFDLFKVSKIRNGRDLSIFCSGIMVSETLTAARELQARGIDAEIINVHTIKPIDRAGIVASAKKTGAVLTVENHNVIGGLKSAVCEVLMEECPVPLRAVGVEDKFGQVGRMPYLKGCYKLRASDIVEKALEVLSLKNGIKHA